MTCMVTEKRHSQKLRQYCHKWVLWLFLPVLSCYGISCGPVQADAEVRAVSDLLRAGEYTWALNILENLIQDRPCDPQLLFLEASAYKTVGETQRAVALYESLINLFPNMPGPYNNLATLYAEKGELKKAENLLLNGLSTDAVYQKLHSNLSKVYIARAAQLYRKALGIEITSASNLASSLAIQLQNSELIVENRLDKNKASTIECLDASSTF